MPHRITVPKVSANVDDVTVTEWLIEPGDAIEEGDPVAEVTTDKAAFEIESPASGILISVMAPLRAVVPVGYFIGLVGSENETDPEAEAANEELMKSYREKVTQSAAPAEQPRSRTRTARVRATPRARRLAREHGIDLEVVSKETGAPTITETILAPYINNS